MKFIDEKSHGFLCAAKSVEFAGFTEESYNWIFIFKSILEDQCLHDSGI